MKLIADSGSSKTHWVLQTETEQISFYTLGLNPFFVTEELVHSELGQAGFGPYREQVSQIIFYGASCSSPDRQDFIRQILGSCFTNAKEIQVDHDMVASCIALFGNEPGIACILGTGSNSCVWNGRSITANMPALGYILGDEGSGAAMGKEILRMYLYDMLSEPIRIAIAQDMSLNKEDIFNAVYKGELPNRFLAQFSRLASEHRSDTQMQQIIHQQLADFIRYHILCYPESKHLPIASVGSIAAVFQSEFEEELANQGLTLSHIVHNPIERLVAYHLS